MDALSLVCRRLVGLHLNMHHHVPSCTLHAAHTPPLLVLRGTFWTPLRSLPALFCASQAPVKRGGSQGVDGYRHAVDIELVGRRAVPMVGCPPVSWKRFAPDFLHEQAPIRHVLCRSGAVGKVNGRHLSVLRYARGRHHHLLCLVDALFRPAVGAPALVLTLLRPFSDACSCALSWSS